MKVDAIRLVIKDTEVCVLVKTKGVWTELLSLNRLEDVGESATLLSKEAKRIVDKSIAKYYFNKYHDGD